MRYHQGVAVRSGAVAPLARRDRRRRRAARASLVATACPAGSNAVAMKIWNDGARRISETVGERREGVEGGVSAPIHVGASGMFAYFGTFLFVASTMGNIGYQYTTYDAGV